MIREDRLSKPGSKPDVLTIQSDWQKAVTRALAKKRPAEGWPERPVKKRKRRKTK